MKTPSTLLIFAYECYPYNRQGSTIGAQRPYQFAKNLANLGWKVVVLCCDHEERRTLAEKDIECKVSDLYLSYQEELNKNKYCIIPLPSLHHYGWADYLWTLSVRKGKGDTYIGKPFPFSLIRKVAVLYNQLMHGDYSWSWTPVAMSFAERLKKDFSIDIVIGEHSPDAGIVLANHFSKKHKIPWIADFRDQVLWPFKGLFKKVYQLVVRKIVHSAAFTINVNPYWTSLDKELFGKPAHTIVNGYDHEWFENTKAHQFPAFTVSYFGSFNEQFQDITPSLQAFAKLLEKYRYPKDVLLFYRGLLDAVFLEQCLKAGIPASHLDISGYVSNSETIAYMKGSSVLLIYSTPPYKVKNRFVKKGIYPGKLFEYVGAGVPILLIPSDEGLLDSFIREEKKGLASSSVEEAVAFLEQQYLQWKKGVPSFWSASTDRQRYSRQSLAQQLDDLLRSIK